MNNPAPKYRWLQFYPRTILVGMTLATILCIGIYHLRWAGQRREFLAVLSLPEVTGKAPITARRVGRFPTGLGPDRSAPGLLWLFGEPGQIMLWVRVDLDRDENISPRGFEQVHHLRNLFPEADIKVMRGSQSTTWFLADNSDQTCPAPQL